MAISTLLQGDCRTVLPTLLADHFDCIVTSPPYFGLRDYGCAGQIGLESTLDAYLETLVGVCRELRRVLKPSGVFFLVIGDSYAASGKGGNPFPTKQQTNVGSLIEGHRAPRDGFKPKDLCLVPERLGILLQADGWWVRSKIIWHKRNPMPESVTDRPTSAHETIWMLTKAERYYWDQEAVAEEASSFGRQHSSGKSPKTVALEEDGTHNKGGDLSINYEREKRSLRNVWSMASHPFPGAHFATFPPELVERCIKAACPIGGHVLDPFGGAGTTGLVAERLGRDCTLIELNEAYVNMARARIEADAPLFATVAAE